MSEIHSNPSAHGQRFGEVIVTVDVAAGDCIVRAPQKKRGGVTPEMKSMHLQSAEEIVGAWNVQRQLDTPIAQDIARALKYAATRINQGSLRGKAK